MWNISDSSAFRVHSGVCIVSKKKRWNVGASWQHKNSGRADDLILVIACIPVSGLINLLVFKGGLVSYTI